MPELRTELTPAQERVVRRIKEQQGMVVAHGLGSGKTLSSIAAINSIPGEHRVLVPAALQENYRKEIEKHVKGTFPTEAASVQGAVLRNEMSPAEMLTIDEAHRARELSTNLNRFIRDYPANKRLLLTASPVYNRPSDIAHLVNLAAGEQVLPQGSDFDKRYVDKPSKSLLKAWITGHKAPRLQRKGELQKVLNKWVDYQESVGEGYPDTQESVKHVAMNPEQSKLYAAARGELPWLLRRKIEMGLPPEKKELARINAFQSQTRQIGGSTRNYQTEGQAPLTPKVQQAMTDLQEKLDANPRAKAVIYSNYLNTLQDYSNALNDAGVSNALFTGKITPKVRKQAINDYNAGKIRTLLLSSSGGEGLDLKGTRTVQVLEPHWNSEKIKQVIGRASRRGSHAHLPSDEQNVDVVHYLTHPQPTAMQRLFKKRPSGIDQYLKTMSEQKENLNQEVRGLLRKEGAVSKMDISSYYADPAVRQQIMHQLQNRQVLAVQNPRNKDKVYRRNISPGRPIQITQATDQPDKKHDLAWFTDRRFSEFHPVIGKQTDEVWVDIDPGDGKTTEELKPIVTKVEDALKGVKAVDQTRISYSGGRGFYVRGDLNSPQDTAAMRRQVQSALRSAFQDDESIVDKKPAPGQIRLDTSTLKDQGSIRADYSINSETGNVAIPLPRRELRGFKPEQASLQRILKEKEFAPGIPRQRRMYPIPEDAQGKTWTLAIQEHNAKRAGKHWDMRLVDPETGYAHSWAIPKSRFPEEKGRPLLAVRTPTHTANYALNFGEGGPKQIGKGYGSGDVEIKHKEPVKIENTTKNRVIFSRGDSGEKYTVFRTGRDKWLLRHSGQMKESQDMTPYQQGYHAFFTKLGMNPQPQKAEEIKQPLEMMDNSLAAGQLARTIAQLDASEYTNERKQDMGSDNQGTAEERLNRPTSWGASTDIPLDYMQGATTPIPGGGF